MPANILINRLLPRGLALVNCGFKTKTQLLTLWLKKKSTSEACPKCAKISSTVYDHREVKIKECPFLDVPVLLKISKRRFFCKSCRLPFTEGVRNVKKWGRQTERYCRYVYDLALHYSNLYSAQKKAKCSSGFIYKQYFRELSLKQRQDNSIWPESVGIDEHFFGYNKKYGYREFVTVFVDHKKRRFKEVALGRDSGRLKVSLSHMDGRDKVKFITMDLSETYRKFIKEYFPNALRIADKFHVIRLLRLALKRYYAAIKNNTNGRLKRLLLANGSKLPSDIRNALNKGLRMYPDLQQIYIAKECLHKIYRMPNYQQADEFMTKLTDKLSRSILPELLTLRKTLLSWRDEILAYFQKRLTNGLVEGLNNKAKQIKRRAYGFRSFENYRLKLITAHI